MEDTIQKLREYFSTRTEIKVAYIFGSKVSKRENRLSDIDIAILINEALLKVVYPYGYKARILTDLMKLLKTNKVDLVILNQAPPLLRHRVIYYGRLIYSCAESDRINLEVRTINEYNDLKRLLDVHFPSEERVRR